MKRTIALILSVIILVSILSGCGKKQEEPTKIEHVETEIINQVKEETPAPKETVKPEIDENYTPSEPTEPEYEPTDTVIEINKSAENPVYVMTLQSMVLLDPYLFNIEDKENKDFIILNMSVSNRKPFFIQMFRNETITFDLDEQIIKDCEELYEIENISSKFDIELFGGFIYEGSLCFMVDKGWSTLTVYADFQDGNITIFNISPDGTTEILQDTYELPEPEIPEEEEEGTENPEEIDEPNIEEIPQEIPEETPQEKQPEENI